MKRMLIIFGSASLVNFTHAEEAKLKEKKDQISYSVGVSVGQSIGERKIELNQDYFLSGLKDGLANKYSLMNAEEVKTALNNLQSELAKKYVEEMKAKGSKNLADGEKFLKANKKKKGVVTLPSGLQYRVINAGKGDSPKSSDTVVANYRGKLLDGTEFDSSYARNEPAKLPLKQVIPGWSEALTLMKPGAKWEIFIPAKLAYGENAPPVIGPNACLTFEVELLSVEKASLAQDAGPKEPELKE